MTKKPLSGIASIKKAAKPLPYKPSPHGEGGRGTASAVDRVLSQAAQMRLSFPCTTNYLSYHVCPIRPCGAPSPRGEGGDTRIPSSKQAAHHPCESIRSPKHRHPERSRGIFIALPPYAHIRPHSNDTLVLPFRLSLTHVLPVCKKDPSTSVGMTGGRQVISHSLSHRCVELCLFEALYPAPLARAVWPHRKAP